MCLALVPASSLSPHGPRGVPDFSPIHPCGNGSSEEKGHLPEDSNGFWLISLPCMRGFQPQVPETGARSVLKGRGKISPASQPKVPRVQTAPQQTQSGLKEV